MFCAGNLIKANATQRSVALKTNCDLIKVGMKMRNTEMLPKAADSLENLVHNISQW